MKVVYNSFDGRYSDSPRVLYETYRDQYPGEHLWLADPAHLHGFPADVATVPIEGPAAVAALESADLVVANTHLEAEWTKAPGATYLQTWHGTPLKRIHHDVLWAPEGRLAELDRDVARWDHLVSPNAVSTPRLRAAFGWTGSVLETGYPRNDVLTSASAPRTRARVRKALGIPDGVTAVLYTPTWRDRDHFEPPVGGLEFAVPLDELAASLGPGFVLLPRLHYKVTHLRDAPAVEGVVDVSYHPDVAELFLAADVMVTDYSSTMFDFAATGKPMVFYAYDLEAYRDSLRGFYFDLEPVAPGPVLSRPEELLHALRTLDEGHAAHRARYRAFRRTFCSWEDGRSTERLRPVFEEAARRPRRQERFVVPRSTRTSVSKRPAITR
ncbi:CDP-glycerol glycerophosphotransferase family protein [Microlunatus antarcticus]|uniref:CDP-glycerol glycerophosphotransferase n=1 Tax=Microlunatus antarcticus TaxID=53388 RepID=A0A7W5JXL8_9ACTN|nr:CDP-glycerol glycerophosphotransferase family protein [Microlunatus antarcticus]MBB3328197.1 CDP-glycerol glycerophosphotransferase [Microlunatus antarcticus]